MREEVYACTRHCTQGHAGISEDRGEPGSTPGPAALFGLPPAGRALLYAALQKDLGRVVCIVTPGEAEATHFADDLKALGLTAAVFPPRDFMLRPVEGAGREYEYRRLSVLGAAGGRAAERRLRARRGAAAIHGAPGRVPAEHPHPQARHGLQPGGAGGAAVCRRVRPAQPGGRPGPVQRPGRHRGHLRAGHAPARPCGVLGR